jgi:hypothetical protein
MFGLKPKLPVTDDERNWVDDGLDQLSRMHGRTRMLYCKVVEPTDGFFPTLSMQAKQRLKNCSPCLRSHEGRPR